MRELQASEAATKLGDFLAVDVRGAHEFEGPLGHLSGARLIPLPELEARVGELPRGRALLLVCRSGARSAKACQQLEALGLGPATNLTGGMIAWNRAGLPVERARSASPAALVENAVLWLAQVTAQAPDAVRAKLAGALGAAARGQGAADAARALDWIEAAAGEAASPPPDLAMSLAAYRAALAAL